MVPRNNSHEPPVGLLHSEEPCIGLLQVELVERRKP